MTEAHRLACKSLTISSFLVFSGIIRQGIVEGAEKNLGEISVVQ
jgi:hypothetical protein